tara:strand:+ start:210 stop:668 length:459 start_codon:yes stop_codon:yes gene_type:complete
MELSNLKPAEGATSKRKRIGRGNATGQGRTAGKGHKGYKSRSGTKAKFHFEGGQTPLARRLPKRGMGKGKFNHLSSSKKNIQIINLADLVNLKVKDIDKNVLYTNGLISNVNLPVKILANGDLKDALNINVEFFSSSAKQKIEKAGGKAQSI